MEEEQKDYQHNYSVNIEESSPMLEIETAAPPVIASSQQTHRGEEMEDPAVDPAATVHTTHRHTHQQTSLHTTIHSNSHPHSNTSLNGQPNSRKSLNINSGSGFVLTYESSMADVTPMPMPMPAAAPSPAPAPAPAAAPPNGSRESILQRLSEALLRRSLAKIDLSQRGLGASDARLVKMALLNNSNLSVLKLGYNNLGDKGVETLVGGISEHRSLRSLDLGFNNFGDEGCRALAAALQESAEKAGNFGTLRTLYLAGNLIGEDGAMALADVIRRGSSLQKLYMTGNRLGPDGVKALTEALIEIELRRQHYAKENFGESSDYDHNLAFYSMSSDINITDSIQHSSGTNTASTDGTQSSGMEELFLGGTGLGSVGCQAVARLLETTSCLRVLSLPNCEIRDEEVSMLASSIKANRESIRLESLQLSFNSITSKGLEYLVNAIWGSHTIKELRFDNNEIGDRGAQQLAAVLPYVNTLETLDVGFNVIKAAGMKPLMKAVAETQHLLSLSLSGNAIDTSASKAVSYALAYNRSLKSLFLVHCSIGLEGKRHISAGAVSNSRTALREISGFKIGPVIVTLGFPPALEHWTNDQVLNFVHLMWDRTPVDDEASEEKVLDPLNFLPGSPDDSSPNKPLSGPIEATIVIDVAKRAFESLVANGVDVFSRQPGHPSEPFDSPFARDAIILESLDETSGEETLPLGSSVIEPISSSQTQSFVAPPDPYPVKKHNLPDPSRKKRIVEWLCSNIQHLNKLSQLPFNSTELWKLHHHYFTPVVNESGGNVTHSRYASSVPEVSRGSSVNGPVNSSKEGSTEKLLIPVSDPSLPASPAGVSSLPMLKRKVSYRFLGDAVLASHSRVETRSASTNLNAVSKMLEDGLNGHGLQPKNKRARRNRTRISFLPRVKRKLDSYLDVCHEKALITMRQLYYVEQAILRGSVNPIDPVTTSRTHLCGHLAADAETIVVDMI